MITHHSSLNDFTSQIRYVLDSYQNHNLKESSFSNIVMGGLGGSGIGAQIVKSWIFDKISLPIETISDYDLPAFADEKTLVILNSYSGNTEETLSLFAQAIEKKCTILCIASGGQLAANAKEHNIQTYQLETGFQPRMTIGYGLSFLFMILGELCAIDTRTELEDVITQFEEYHEHQIQSAEKIFMFYKASIKNKFVVVADKYYAPVAVRFCQQVNENSKLEAFLNILPEANHNVIESYYGKLPTNFLFIYSDKNPRVHARFDFLTSHLEVENNKVMNLLVPEFSIFTIFDVIYRLDWVTLFLADEHGFDPMQIKNIMELKDYLQNLEIVEEEEDLND